MKRIVFLLALFVAGSALATKVADVTVRALDGFGGDTSSVLTRCQTRAGSVYDPVVVSRDVVALNESGEFQEITADVRETDEGVEVFFFVKRKMRYQAPLNVQGNTVFSLRKISKDADLKDGKLYGEGEFAAAAERVKLAYLKKSYLDVKVLPITKVTAENYCTLTLLIEEGARQKIDGCVFKGADVDGVDQGELRKAVGDLPWWNPMGWFSDGAVTREQLVQTAVSVREIFLAAGYLDATVREPEVVKNAEGEYVRVYTVKPGIRYTIGDVRIKGLTRYPEGVVKERSELPERGAVAGSKALSDAARRIQIVVGSGDVGLADTYVDVQTLPTAQKGVLDVVFQVEEGVPVVINDVIIEGNDYTKDKVIRREIALGPGDRMLEDRADRSQKRLENLNYFSRVKYYLRTTNLGQDENGADYRNLVYEVEEKNTGSLMAGVAGDSVDSVYFTAEASQANFDLFAPGKLFRGAGQKGRLSVSVGPRIQTYEASVTEPYLFDRLLEFTVEAHRRQRWYDDYDIIRTGGSVGISYPVKFWPTWNPYGRFGIQLSGELIEFDDIDRGTWTYKGQTVSLAEEDRLYGDAFEPVVHFFWAHDTRDSYRMPTTGSTTRLFLDLSAGGDNDYYRMGINHRMYFSTWKKYGHVLMLAFRAETIDGISDDVPIYNRMFLGGPRSIRGIEYRGVSPYAKRNDSGEWTPWGGQTLACMNVEYIIPVVNMLRFVVFSDLGSVSADEFDLSDDFAWTAGVGFRVDLPMFPIRLDFGFPIEKPEHAEEEIFSFTVNYEF